MRGVLIICGLFFSSNLFSQFITFRVAVGSSEDDVAACVRQTSDNGYIVAGTTGSVVNTNSDVYLFKLDSLGELVWSKHFGTSAGSENGKKVIQIPDGGYLVVGFSNSSGISGYDVYVIKTDAEGNLIWENKYGGDNWDFGHDITILPNGNYGIAGYTYSFGNGGSDFYYLEIDESGNEIMSKTFGGTNDDIAYSIIVSDDQKIILCGESISFGNGVSDGYVIKSELNGNSIWSKTFGGDSLDYFADVIQISDGNFLAVGSTKSFGLNHKDFFIVKFTSSGDLVFERNIGGPGDEEAREVVESIGEIFSITGYTTSDGAGGKAIQLLQVNSGGWWVNSPQYGSEKEEDGFSIDKTHDNGFIIAGITDGYNAQRFDVLIMKTDSTGNTGNSGDVINIVDNLVSLPESSVVSPYHIVYTNNNILTVQTDKHDISGVSIYSQTGQLVKELNFQQPTDRVNVDILHFSSGLYFLKTDFRNSYSKTTKLFISK